MSRRTWRRATIWSRLRRFIWRVLRGTMLLAAALGPRMPPPPPPPPPPTEQYEAGGEVHEEE